MMFDNRYEVILADTASSKAINFKLRYRVFCLEKGFENPDHFREQMEQDEHDDNAVHFLVRDKRRDQWVAASRLVIGTADSLPVNEVTKVDLTGLPRETVIAEFSRLLIVDGHRKINGDTDTLPEVILGLIRAAREYSRKRSIDHWIFLCRRSLSRVTKSLGIAMEPIGPPCIFRGVRTPYRLDLKSAFDEVPDRSQLAHEMLNRHWQSFTRYSSLFHPLRGRELSGSIASAA